MTVLEDKLNPIIAELSSDLGNKTPYAALSLALTSPDICSYIEAGTKSNVGKRYKAWIDKYFLTTIDYNGRMKSGDLYALRCAYLHNGTNDLSFHKEMEIVNKFRFIYSVHNNIIHKNSTINTTSGFTVMQLDVNSFCKEVAAAIQYFIDSNKENAVIENNAKELMIIENDMYGFSI